MLDLTLESVSVNINGKKIDFYPLNFKALRLLSHDFEMLRTGGISTADRLESIIRVLLASANRIEQQLTEEEMVGLFDPKWATEVLEEINKLSGLRQVQTETSADGAVVVRPTKPPNGVASTQP